ncbi:hypothetical protein SAMN04515617_1144 [Collimonas sp. OK242]|jgi:hypothetical protein|nr:hypothetical protein [Collimonas sp. OK242]SDY40565.1 hypothetical protein SAMN04515617_1144 [Collimonas sp. OK242]
MTSSAQHDGYVAASMLAERVEVYIDVLDDLCLSADCSKPLE